MNKNLTALIADDEAHMRTFMKLMLKDMGVEKVYLMQNGMDALEAYQEYEPDLVLMDINMNKMNGLDALSHILKINPKAAVVMMTAVATREAVESCNKQGAVYYILKTQPPVEIKLALQEVLAAVRPDAFRKPEPEAEGEVSIETDTETETATNTVDES